MKIVIHDFWETSRDASDFVLGAKVDLELRCRVVGLESDQVDVTALGGPVPEIIDGEQTVTLHVVHAEMEEA